MYSKEMKLVICFSNNNIYLDRRKVSRIHLSLKTTNSQIMSFIQKLQSSKLNDKVLVSFFLKIQNLNNIIVSIFVPTSKQISMLQFQTHKRTLSRRPFKKIKQQLKSLKYPKENRANEISKLCRISSPSKLHSHTAKVCKINQHIVTATFKIILQVYLLRLPTKLNTRMPRMSLHLLMIQHRTIT